MTEYEFIDAGDVFKDDNHGLLYGLQEAGEFPAYCEWFATPEERELCVLKNNMHIINR